MVLIEEIIEEDYKVVLDDGSSPDQEQEHRSPLNDRAKQLALLEKKLRARAIRSLKIKTASKPLPSTSNH